MQQTIAPLNNVVLCMKAMEIITNPDAYEGLDRIISFYGKSGSGKSVAAAYTANQYDAFYVECRSVWTKKSLLEGICEAVGVAPEKTMARMVRRISEALCTSGKPLIIDEMDYVVERKAVDIIRDIYQESFAPILLIGEEDPPPGSPRGSSSSAERRTGYRRKRAPPRTRACSRTITAAGGSPRPTTCSPT
jgi:hypothetical protein